MIAHWMPPVRAAHARGVFVRSRHGWILVETLAALVVLSVGILAVNRSLGESLLTRAMARDYTQARFFLEQVMSELELQPVLVDGATGSGDFGKDNPRFSYSWAVSRVDLNLPALPPQILERFPNGVQPPVPYLGKISLTVKWTRSGRAFSRTAETLIDMRHLYVEKQQQQDQTGASLRLPQTPTPLR